MFPWRALLEVGAFGGRVCVVPAIPAPFEIIFNGFGVLATIRWLDFVGLLVDLGGGCYRSWLCVIVYYFGDRFEVIWKVI